MRNHPHASWAQVYDMAYERTFGKFYDHLTDMTTRVIAERVQAGGKIIDFGAGTGRLSIPMAEMGYDVTAVEPCEEMLVELRKKIRQGMLVQPSRSKMQDYKSPAKFDVALCVFTVLLYFLEEESLYQAFSNAHASLKPGGIFLVDIPSRQIFQGYSMIGHSIERIVSIIEQPEDLFIYRENLKVTHIDGDHSTYYDEFLIRYWPPEKIGQALESAGFILQEDLSEQFSGSGSGYWLMRKTS